MELEIPSDELDFNILDLAFRSCDRILKHTKNEQNACHLRFAHFLKFNENFKAKYKVQTFITMNENQTEVSNERFFRTLEEQT